MQEPPPPATQAPDHGRGGGGRQGNEQDECGEARGDVRPLRDVLDDGSEVEKLIQHQVGAKVQRRIEEGEKAQHAPEADE